jgi:hypothetical protein
MRGDETRPIVFVGFFLTSSPVFWGRMEVGVGRGSAGYLFFRRFLVLFFFAMRAPIACAKKGGSHRDSEPPVDPHPNPPPKQGRELGIASTYWGCTVLSNLMLGEKTVKSTYY